MADYSTNSIQEGDVKMILENDLGNIVEENGFIDMTQTIDTMILLVLSGGNYDDDTTKSTEHSQWWGNEGEAEENQYRSRFQYEASRGIPLTSSSATTLVDAATDDLTRGFVNVGVAKSVEITSIVLVNPKRVQITGNLILSDDSLYGFSVEVDV